MHGERKSAAHAATRRLRESFEQIASPAGRGAKRQNDLGKSRAEHGDGRRGAGEAAGKDGEAGGWRRAVAAVRAGTQ